MKKEFGMSDLGNLSYFLGLEFQILKQGMALHQRKYVKEILNLKLEKHREEDKVYATLFKKLLNL